MGRLGHQPALDGLRGVAIILVMLFHAQPFHGRGLGGGGAFGVDLFFVLSGFLITTLLLERSEPTLWPFYRRRALRLLPAVVAFVVAFVAFYAITAPDQVEDATTNGWLALSYVGNWFDRGRILPEVTHLWSLAVEEQFYIVWPIVLSGAIRYRIRPRHRIAAIIVTVIAVGVWRAVLFEAGDVAAYFRTDARVDALLIGGVVAIIRPTLRRFTAPAASTIGTAAMVAFLAVALSSIGPWVYYGGFTLVAVLAAVIVVAALDDRWALRPLLTSKVLTVIGRVSYSLYLWHFPIFTVVHRHVSGAGGLVLAMVLSTAATALSYRYVEQPFMRWKTRLDAPDRVKRSAAAAVAAST